MNYNKYDIYDYTGCFLAAINLIFGIYIGSSFFHSASYSKLKDSISHDVM